MGQHVYEGHQCQGQCLGLPGLACICVCVDVNIYGFAFVCSPNWRIGAERQWNFSSRGKKHSMEKGAL